MTDLRYAIRTLFKTPGFTFVAVLTLALGIGGNALVFGLVDSVVLHPFPYSDPDRLVVVGVNFPRVADEERFIEVLSAPEVDDIARLQSLHKVIAFDLGNRNISGGDQPERVFTALVAGDPFETIGMPPIAGRGFLPEEIRRGGLSSVILSHRFWQSRFGGDASIVGRTVRVNGSDATVVGIMPPGLLLLGTDLWIPLAIDVNQWPRGQRQLTVLGRLRPEATLTRANAELQLLAGRTARDHAATNNEYTGWTLRADTWSNALSRQLRPAAVMLLGAVALVLLIACVNVTNLILARAMARRREIAVRMTLGAGRFAIARQVLFECLLLALAGSVAAVWLARIGLAAAITFLPEEIVALGVQPTISVRVLVYSAGVAAIAALLIGLLPALHAASSDPQTSLQSEGRTATVGRYPQRMRFALIVAEVSLAMVLLVGAGLLLKSWSRLHAVDPGVRTSGVLTMRLTLPPQTYRGEAIPNFFQQLIARVRSTPGVTDAAAVSQLPTMSFSPSPVRVEGREPSNIGELPTALFTIVSPGYFTTLNIPIRIGRTFTDRDRADAPPVAVVNETFAYRHLNVSVPLGQRVQFGDRWLEIVGVTGDTRSSGLTAPVRPEVYLSMMQAPPAWNQYFLVVAARDDATSLLPSIRRAIAEIDPQQPAYAIQTLDTVFAVSTLRERVSTWLLGAFAGLALLLAAVGIYGVIAFAVTLRTKEIGVRMALGATDHDVRAQVVTQAAGLIGIGLAIGVACSLALTPMIAQLLFEVPPHDPATFVLAGLVLSVAGVSAAFWPAHRASRTDPIVALRAE